MKYWNFWVMFQRPTTSVLNVLLKFAGAFFMLESTYFNMTHAVLFKKWIVTKILRKKERKSDIKSPNETVWAKHRFFSQNQPYLISHFKILCFNVLRLFGCIETFYTMLIWTKLIKLRNFFIKCLGKSQLYRICHFDSFWLNYFKFVLKNVFYFINFFL